MKPNRRAQLGSVSSGTFLIEDLLPAFADAFARICPRGAHSQLRRDLYTFFRRKIARFETVEAEELLIELEDALNDLAPEYVRFGAHEGAGADFGFWPCMELIKELPQYDDWDKVPRDYYGDYFAVNDHGNVTVYRRSRNNKITTLLELV